MKNINRFEAHLRIALGIATAVTAAYYHMWIFVIIGVVLLYTGAYRHCLLYSLLGVNRKESERNYYLSQLPKYNSEPEYMFNSDGSLKFRNEAAEKIIPEFDSISGIADIRGKSINDSLNENESFYEQINKDDLSYLVRFKAVKDLDTVLGYGFNITELVQTNQEIINTQRELVYRMGEIGEKRSNETGNHVKRVAEYSYLLAKHYGLSDEETETLKIASPMHDIGKVSIPDNILKKPGPLDSGEWEIMKTHSIIGRDLLAHSDRPILKAASIVAGEHHERWNGSGYPYGLAKDDIHIFGRITAVADVFDALGSDRVYKKAWPLEKILDYFITEKEKHFDPDLVELFLNNLDRFLAIKNKYADAP